MRSKFEWRYFMPIFITFVMTIIFLTMTACQSQTTRVTYDGSALFQGYCASCHGPSGAGDGPVAPHLLNAVPDLRTLAQRADPPLDKAQIINTIDGRSMRAVHGSNDMPVWGWTFRDVDESELETQARLDALATYVLSIQK